MRAVIVGARRKRQGIGEFTTRYLRDAGLEIAGIVGTSEATVAEARQRLDDRYGIRPRGYTMLEAALDGERPDVVAICSPHAFHERQLELVAQAGAHCLCDKPLLWSEDAASVQRISATLAAAFHARQRLLEVATQWPFTLAGFEALHGRARGDPLRSFEMHLCPSSRGQAMIPEAAPHVFSMLQALSGNGEALDPVTRYLGGSDQRMSLEFRYVQGQGETRVRCRFDTTPEQPRPAAYAINGHWVRRRIRLPEYALELESDSGSVRLEDPLKLMVEDFVERVRLNAQTDVPKLLTSMLGARALADSA